MRISDWSSDVCSSDLAAPHIGGVETAHQIGGAFAGGEALVEVLGVEEVIDENAGVARIGARVETDRRSRPIDRAFALDLVIERARAIAQADHERAARLAPAALGIGPALLLEDKRGRASCWERVCQYV